MITFFSFSQGNIKGTVKDSTGSPIEKASVLINEISRIFFTDQNGEFKTSTLKSGVYSVEVSFLGYQTERLQVEVGEGSEMLDFNLKIKPFLTDEVVIEATRYQKEAPATFKNIEKKDLQQLNLGQDLPVILNWTPSMVTTSDAGAGIGYTGMRIRGSDQTRINVTVNGIPINDSESQGVFWVNMPDLASSLGSVQIQRGLGTSTNGSGAFGASVNLETNNLPEKPTSMISSNAGSFNTFRNTVQYSSGRMKNGLAIEGRLSSIQSDGYIDRASSDLKSYYLSAGYYGEKTIVKAITFAGRERTYQSWFGTPQSRIDNDVEGMLEHAANEGLNEEQTQNLLNSGRTYNFYLYDNQVDNYNQDHYQLHWIQELNENLQLKLAGHYTYGRGYFEQFRYDDDFTDYGLSPVVYQDDFIFSDTQDDDGEFINSTFGDNIPNNEGLEELFIVQFDSEGDTIMNESGDVLLNAIAQASSSDMIRRRWLDNDFYGATYSLEYKKGIHQLILGGGTHLYRGDHFGEIIWAEVNDGIAHEQEYYRNFGNKDDINGYLKWNMDTDRWGLMADLQYRFVDYTTRGIDNDLLMIDVNRQFNFFNPKIGARYKLSPRNSIYFYAGIGNREPVRNDFIDALENEEPEHETLTNIELGYTTASDNLLMNINGYAMLYQNQLVLTGELNDVGSTIRRNVDESYRVGFELDATYFFSSNFSWNINATFSQNKIGTFENVVYDYTNGFDVIRDEFTDTDISFSPSIIAGSRMMWTPLKNFDVMFLSKYVGDQFLDNTSNADRKIDAYFVNDLKIAYTIHDIVFERIELNLLINNLLNAEYSSNGYTYSYIVGDEITENFFYPQAGTNFLAGLNLIF